MFKVRLSTLEQSEGINFPIKEGFNLEFTVKLTLAPLVKDPKTIEKYFLVVLNGEIIEPEKWFDITLKSSDEVLVAPKLGDDTAKNLFKVAAIIAISVFTYGAAGGAAAGWEAAAWAAGANVLASVALNSIFPPPVPNLPNSDISATGNTADSQMYRITGQSNTVKPYGNVPKVYGTHRIFPTIAANPYTQIENDPDTGELVQFYYAVYDLGLGPLIAADIKIGDTPIENFGDYTVNFVDFNRPDEPEGFWDEDVDKDLQIYKGQVSTGLFSVSLDKNQNDSPPSNPEDYQAIRNCPVNTDSVEQEILLSLVNPSGLYSFDNIGNKGIRNIDMKIEFAKVGTETWRSFNDLNYVKSFDAKGAQGGFTTVTATPYPYTDNSPVYTKLNTFHRWEYDQFGYEVDWQYATWGYPKGQTFIVLASDPNIGPGSTISLPGGYTRVIVSSQSFSPGWVRHNLNLPLGYTHGLYTWGNFEFAFHGNYPDIFSKLISTASGSFIARAKPTGVVRIAESKTTAVYSTFSFVPKEIASYKIRITRIDSYSDADTISDKTNIRDTMVWTGLQSRFNIPPIKTKNRHLFLELKIRATNQLSGAIQNLSVVCTSILDVWDGTIWEKQPTSNPAWVFADLLTGSINKRAISKDRLHVASLLEWANFCDQVPTSPPGQTFNMARFVCNYVLDYSPTLTQALHEVSSAAQASLNLIDGKYGVLIDKLKTVPVQIFTPRNSKNFSSTRSYTKKPHALKVTFIEPAANWETREILVYDDGYNILNATVFEEIASFACTNLQQAWRFGRYIMAQNALRQENITIDVDFENLVCTRGDYVKVTQDVMEVGGYPARVKSISGSDIVIDEAIETGAFSYGYTFRGVGGIQSGTLTVVSADTFTLSGPMPSVGDLIVVGIVNEITFDCLVRSIEPGDNLTARLTLIEKADGVYTVESSATIPDYKAQISIAQSKDFSAPAAVINLIVADNYYECTGSGLAYKVTLDWDAPVNAATDLYEIWVNTNGTYVFVTTTNKTIYTYTASRSDLDVIHKFKIVAVSATGKKLNLSEVPEVSALVATKTTKPGDVLDFNIDITGEVLQMFWTKVDDCAVAQYQIRYSPALTAAASWGNSIPLMTTNNQYNLAATHARTGTYLIKAVDWEGNQSENPAISVTTIPNLFGLNEVAVINDFPTLPGNISRVIATNGLILLDQSSPGIIYGEGFYYYQGLLDLGDIYSVRLQSKVEAEGLASKDLMVYWNPLSSLDKLYHPEFNEWDVETQYRATNTLNTIESWVTLDSITFMETGSPEIWTAWKSFKVGDVTGRIFQFRLRLLSFNVGVTPRVYNGNIIADMPDRIESFTNIAAITGRRRLNYSPPFMGPGGSPNIQITISGSAQAGDYWTFTDKGLDGVTVWFWTSAGNPASRTFDAVIKGYGRKATAVI